MKEELVDECKRMNENTKSKTKSGIIQLFLLLVLLFSLSFSSLCLPCPPCPPFFVFLPVLLYPPSCLPLPSSLFFCLLSYLYFYLSLYLFSYLFSFLSSCLSSYLFFFLSPSVFFSGLWASGWEGSPLERMFFDLTTPPPPYSS